MIDDLTLHADRLARTPLKKLADARATSSRLNACGWSIDLSRQFLDAESTAALQQFGDSSGLQDAADKLFAGDIVNPSENRPALHWALRAQSSLSGEAESVRQSVLPALAFARMLRPERSPAPPASASTPSFISALADLISDHA